MHFPISKSTKTVHKIVSLAQYAGSQLILKCNVYTWCTRCQDIAPFSMVAGGGGVGEAGGGSGRRGGGVNEEDYS
jgi:hypothetical protein